MTGTKWVWVRKECRVKADGKTIADVSVSHCIEAELNLRGNLIAASPEMCETLEAHQAWEADLIINGDWTGNTLRLTQDQHDALNKVQDLRNSALRKARGES